MKYRRKPKTRALLGEFSSTLGTQVLNVRIYRDRQALVCERELVKRDGTSLTMVLPFREFEAVRALLTSDPHYRRVGGKILRVLGRLRKVLHEHHRKQLS